MVEQHSTEFWPRDRWPDAFIPRPTLFRRALCWLFGHWWAIHYWSGQGEPDWPQHDYCERCWRFREKASEK